MIQCADCDMTVAAEIAKREARDSEEQLRNRLRHSGLPIDYRIRSRALQHLPTVARQAVTSCDLLGDGARGLFLWGPAGSFKTSVAAAYLADRIVAGATGRYVFVPDLMSEVHASYRSNDAESRDAIVSKCVAARMLVLDDLGKEKASEHAAGVIFEILDGRYRNARKGDWTIVTSNFDLDALCDRFPGEELADPIRRRLSELTLALPMEAA
jgi:DNA replication protein DnaC